MKTADPILDPIGYLVTAKPAPKAQLEDRSKSDNFAGEKGRLAAERDAWIRHQANLKEFDATIKPALKKLEQAFERGTKLVFIETELQRLATVWVGKWFPLSRLGVNEDGNWFWNNDRDETFEVGSAKEAMTGLLEALAPELKMAARRKQSEAQRPERFAAQQEHIKEERRKRLTA